MSSDRVWTCSSVPTIPLTITNNCNDLTAFDIFIMYLSHCSEKKELCSQHVSENASFLHSRLLCKLTGMSPMGCGAPNPFLPQNWFAQLDTDGLLLLLTSLLGTGMPRHSDPHPTVAEEGLDWNNNFQFYLEYLVATIPPINIIVPYHCNTINIFIKNIWNSQEQSGCLDAKTAYGNSVSSSTHYTFPILSLLLCDCINYLQTASVSTLSHS